jgi:LysR family transcriptional regulator, flagellar master operon regulator
VYLKDRTIKYPTKCHNPIHHDFCLIHMNIDLLKTFLEVAKLKHFGRAADRVFLTQSAVSARIKLLEDTLGSTLFIRKRNHIELTTAGRKLANSAELIVKQWEKTKNEINFVTEENQQLVRIGTAFDLWPILVQQWVLQCRQQIPSLLFQIEASSAPLLATSVIAEQLDAALVFDTPYHNGIVSHEVGALELVLVSSEACDFSEVSSKPYCYVDWGSVFSDQHQHILGDVLTPDITFNFSTMALDYLLASGGMGYLSRQQVQGLLDQSVLFEVNEAPVFKREIYFIYRKAHPMAALLSQIIPGDLSTILASN